MTTNNEEKSWTDEALRQSATPDSGQHDQKCRAQQGDVEATISGFWVFFVAIVIGGIIGFLSSCANETPYAVKDLKKSVEKLDSTLNARLSSIDEAARSISSKMGSGVQAKSGADVLAGMTDEQLAREWIRRHGNSNK